jgi:hypothetical protein
MQSSAKKLFQPSKTSRLSSRKALKDKEALFLAIRARYGFVCRLSRRDKKWL